MTTGSCFGKKLLQFCNHYGMFGTKIKLGNPAFQYRRELWENCQNDYASQRYTAWKAHFRLRKRRKYNWSIAQLRCLTFLKRSICVSLRKIFAYRPVITVLLTYKKIVFSMLTRKAADVRAGAMSVISGHDFTQNKTATEDGRWRIPLTGVRRWVIVCDGIDRFIGVLVSKCCRFLLLDVCCIVGFLS